MEVQTMEQVWHVFPRFHSQDLKTILNVVVVEGGGVTQSRTLA